MLDPKAFNYQYFFDHSTELFFSLDLDGNIVNVNQAFSSNFGYSKEFFIKKNISSFLSSESRLQSKKRIENKEATKSNITVYFLHKNGSYHKLNWQLNFIPSEEVFYGIAKDVTLPEKEIKSDQLMKNDHNKDLAQVESEVQSFIHAISHDLRAPVRHMDGFSNWIKEEESKNMSSLGKNLLDKVINSAQKLGQMMDGLLEYSINKNAALQKTNEPLRQIVKSLVAQYNNIETSGNIQWKIASLPTAFVDKQKITLVFEALISNAVKYTSRVQNPIIEIWSEESTSFWTIFIKDNGIGFDMTYHKKLFIIFQKLSEQKDYGISNGIGLANAKSIIENHGGMINGEGTPDNGAFFYFTIPKYC